VHKFLLKASYRPAIAVCFREYGANSPFIKLAVKTTRGGQQMNDARQTVFSTLKLLSYVAVVAMLGSIAYAAAMALRYWPGIAV